jgi:hypothetical protein
MAAINYDAIAQELKRGLVDNERAAACLGGNKPTVLKELYTLSMGGPRQTGKTKWIVEGLIRDPNARAVVINKTMEESFLNYVRRYHHLTPDNKIPTPGGWVSVPADVAKIIRKNPQAVAIAGCNVLTARRFNEIIAMDLEDRELLTQIFIDESASVFNVMRRNKYYTWLAKLTGKYTLTWLIN